MEAQSKKISNCRCHFARLFTLIGEGINQQAGRELVAGIASEAHLDNQGHVSRSVQTAKIFLFGRERRKDRQ